MALKVLVVDDEKLERVLIQKIYDWGAHGFEVIGDVSSGAEGLEFIKNRQPDIIITDINMPNMDGLEFVEKVFQQKEYQGIRIIIITGYREFDYARRAVKLGVDDFLLKPIDGKELAKIAEEIKGEIEQERKKTEEVTMLKEKVTQNEDIVIESFLQRLVENRIEEEEGIHRLQMYQFDSVLEGCICGNIQLDYGKTMSEEQKEWYGKSVIELVHQLDVGEVFSFMHYLGNIILYFKESDVTKLVDPCKRLIGEIMSQLSIRVTIGISKSHSGYDGIQSAYQESLKALSTFIFLGRNRCLFYSDYESIEQRNHDMKDIDWEDFVFSVQNCLVDKVNDYIDEYIKNIYDTGSTNMLWLKYMALNLLIKAESTLHKTGKNLSEIEHISASADLVEPIDSIPSMKRILKEHVNTIMKYNDSIRTTKGRQVIKQALDSIEKNLYNPDLCLKLVASEIYVNESYLSRIFKQEVGESLIGYITRKRIEESIRLLNTTDLKVYEIAERVGIKDPHYFSICFKKQVGVTIKEYRKPIHIENKEK
ncbi:two-component response regulator yesN [Lachnospiraceae bacterium KM106-2]|nr:two-component response regulator yesN [Lachnospiraceae bacterium KM106-2]